MAQAAASLHLVPADTPLGQLLRRERRHSFTRHSQILVEKQQDFINYPSTEGENTWYPQFWGKIYIKYIYQPYSQQQVSNAGSAAPAGRLALLPHRSPQCFPWLPHLCPRPKAIINRGEGDISRGHQLSHHHSYSGKTLLKKNKAAQ